MVLTAKSEVPARVSFAARDMLERYLCPTGIQMKVLLSIEHVVNCVCMEVVLMVPSTFRA